MSVGVALRGDYLFVSPTLLRSKECSGRWRLSLLFFIWIAFQKRNGTLLRAGVGRFTQREGALLADTGLNLLCPGSGACPRRRGHFPSAVSGVSTGVRCRCREVEHYTLPPTRTELS